MTSRRFLLAAGLLLVLGLGALPLVTPAHVVEQLPTRLTDEQFWALSAELSEAGGSFQSDNLLSNERWFQHVIPQLTRTAQRGRVYLGVGPEQNFTYLAALQPKMAFIVDIRRGNLNLHLMYKALFELSADRVEFVSRLFSKPRPKGPSTGATAAEIFEAFSEIETSEPLYKENLAAIIHHLRRTHGFALSADDLQGIEYVYHSFYWFGPAIQYWSTGGRRGGWRTQVTYAELMTATDADGEAHGYLAREDRFRIVKEMHSKNLIVPVVGDFTGSKALRAVGKYLKQQGATVSAFYVSNVEQYLERAGKWSSFCANVATLPLDDTSTFIRSVRTGSYGPGMGLNSELGAMTHEVRNCGGGD